MSQTKIPQELWDLTYLIRCALSREAPEEARLVSMNAGVLFELAKDHSISALVSYGLESHIREEGFAKWKLAREQALRRNILLDAERRVICAEMDCRGIWHMKLKGSVLKDLYPRMEMREMSDQDILFDTTRREEMREYMLARGYDPKGHHDTHHDIYHKEPIYNMELHHTLFELHCDLRLVDYYRNVKEERMIPDGDGTCGYHFSDEDFYIYMVAHAYKHYQDHGVGLRSMVDVYIYDIKKPNLDWAYVEAECAKLGMDKYEKLCRTLSRKLFGSGQELTEEELDMLKYCFESGTHGSLHGHIRHEMKGIQSSEKITFWTKVRYLFRRLFPSPKWMRENDRIARRHPWALPFAWIARIWRGIFKRNENTLSEFRYVMDTEEV